MAFAFCSSQNNMVLSFFLLFFFFESTVKSLTRIPSTTMWPATSTEEMTSRTTEGNLSPVKLVANPDYPVAAGQTVNLRCTAFNEADPITWCWEHLVNQMWQDLKTDNKHLTLTKPEESGTYRCCASRNSSPKTMSSSHTVFIISMHTTVGDNLGISGFFLSLLGLMIIIAILFWLGWQRFGNTLTISNTVAKDPGPEKSPKGELPKADSDGDVYMNYTGTNHAYSDLDPNNMTGDNVYSSLS